MNRPMTMEELSQRITGNPNEAFKNIEMTQGLRFTGFLTTNIIVGHPNPMDVSLFDLEPGEVLIKVPSHFQWPQLLKHLGIFKSTSQARKNGWDKEIREGWSEAIFKKQRKAVFVFKAKNDAR